MYLLALHVHGPHFTTPFLQPTKDLFLPFPAMLSLLVTTAKGYWPVPIISMLIVKIEWDLDESAFMRVAPVDRFFQPRSIRFSHSIVFWTGCMVMSGSQVRKQILEIFCFSKKLFRWHFEFLPIRGSLTEIFPIRGQYFQLMSLDARLVFSQTSPQTRH